MSALRTAAVLAFSWALASAASAELAPWDQARVTGLAQQLVKATDALYDAFFVQPRPAQTPKARRDHARLKADLRRLRTQARGFLADLQHGEGQKETLANFESMIVTVHWAQERAQSVFTTKDVAERAAAVETLLDELAPYYHAEAPVPRSR